MGVPVGAMVVGSAVVGADVGEDVGEIVGLELGALVVGEVLGADVGLVVGEAVEGEALASSEPPATPQCDPIFLGPDVGFATVFVYNDADGTCTLSMAELAAVCSEHFVECFAFLESQEPQPEPEPQCRRREWAGT